jgi:hypothetical protein
LTQRTIPKTDQLLLRTLNNFDEANEAKVDTLAEYDNIVNVLRENSMSYMTRIIRHKKKPTQYYVILLEEI